MNKIWTEEEKIFVKNHAEDMTDKEIAVYLSGASGRKVTIHAVRKIRQGYGLKKKSGRGVSELLNKVKDEAHNAGLPTSTPENVGVQAE